MTAALGHAQASRVSVCSSVLLIQNPGQLQRLGHDYCSVSKVDFDVVVFTNTQPDAIVVEDKQAMSAFWEFEDEADMVQAHAPIFETLTEPQRQRAVVNLDGELLCTTCLKAWLMLPLTQQALLLCLTEDMHIIC